MPAPTTSVLDTFTGAAGTALPTYSANWAQLTGSVPRDCKISASGTKAANSGGSDGADYWVASSFAESQEVFLTVTDIPTTGGLTLVMVVRCQNPTNSGTINYYDVRWTFASGAADTWTIGKSVAGVNSTLGTDATGTFDLVNGDKIWMSAIGSTITAYRGNGGTFTQILTATDSAVTGTGYIGMYLSSRDQLVDDFGGGATTPSTFIPQVLAYG